MLTFSKGVEQGDLGGKSPEGPGKHSPGPPVARGATSASAGPGAPPGGRGSNMNEVLAKMNKIGARGHA